MTHLMSARARMAHHRRRGRFDHVSNPATSTVASCGTKLTTAYARGNGSANIDTSADPMSTVHTSASWDGRIPNWWH
jgi:hypothetical protein